MADDDFVASYTPSSATPAAGRARRTPRRKGLGLKNRSHTDINLLSQLERDKAREKEKEKEGLSQSRGALLRGDDDSPKSEGSSVMQKSAISTGSRRHTPTPSDLDDEFLALLDGGADPKPMPARRDSADGTQSPIPKKSTRRRLDVGERDRDRDRDRDDASLDIKDLRSKSQGSSTAGGSDRSGSTAAASKGMSRPPLKPNSNGNGTRKKKDKDKEKGEGDGEGEGKSKWDSAEMMEWLKWLGLDPHLPQDEPYLYFAEVGLSSTLPFPWSKKENDAGEAVYVNSLSNEVVDQHPLVPALKNEINMKRLGTSNASASESTMSSSLAGLLGSDLDLSISTSTDDALGATGVGVGVGEGRRRDTRQGVELSKVRRRNEQLEAQLHSLTLKLDMVQKNRAAELEQIKYEFENRLRASLAGMDSERESWHIDREQIAKEMESNRRKHSEELERMRSQTQDEISSLRRRLMDERDEEIDAIDSKHKAELESVRAQLQAEHDSRVAELKAVMETRRNAHNEELKKIREQGTAHASLDALTKTVSESAASLETLRMQVEVEVKASLAQRERILEKREEEVRETMTKLSNEQRRVDEERQQIVDSQQQQQQDIAARLHDLQIDRSRLSKEHARLEALQVALQAERESTARTLAEERSELDEIRRERVREQERFARESEEERRTVSRERATMMAEQKRLAERESAAADRIRELEHNLSNERANFEQMMAESRPETIQHEREKLTQDIEQFEKDSVDLAEMAAVVQAKSADVRTMYEKAVSEREKAEALNMAVTRIRDALEHEKAQLQDREMHVASMIKKMESDRAQIAKDMGLLREEKIRRAQQSVTAADLLNAHLSQLMSSSSHVQGTSDRLSSSQNVPERENRVPTSSQMHNVNAGAGTSLSSTMPVNVRMNGSQVHSQVQQRKSKMISQRTSDRLVGILSDVQSELSDLNSDRGSTNDQIDRQAHFLKRMQYEHRRQHQPLVQPSASTIMSTSSSDVTFDPSRSQSQSQGMYEQGHGNANSSYVPVPMLSVHSLHMDTEREDGEISTNDL